MKITRFEDIDARQDARELARQVYTRTRCGDFGKDFGLRDQIRRAAGSAMHNIAEGFDSGSDSEFTRFLRYAQRSCTEVQNELYVALDQKYVTEQQFQALFEQAEKTRAKIGGFIKYLLSSTKDSNRRESNRRPTTDEETKDEGQDGEGQRTSGQRPRAKDQGLRTYDRTAP
jgi:four helix bundle protein